MVLIAQRRSRTRINPQTQLILCSTTRVALYISNAGNSTHPCLAGLIDTVEESGRRLQSLCFGQPLLEQLPAHLATSRSLCSDCPDSSTARQLPSLLPHCHKSTRATTPIVASTKVLSSAIPTIWSLPHPSSLRSSSTPPSLISDPPGPPVIPVIPHTYWADRYHPPPRRRLVPLTRWPLHAYSHIHRCLLVPLTDPCRVCKAL